MKRSREAEAAAAAGADATVESIAVVTIAAHTRLPEIDGIDGSDDDVLPPSAKITELDMSSNKSQSDIRIHCSLPPHKEPMAFSSYSEYESHYRSQHTNRCVQCRKNFPSSHLLSLHIEEVHDSFIQARRDRGERTVSLQESQPTTEAKQLTLPQYSCFVEGCDRKCSTPHKRKMHLIDKHLYPKNFFFAITREGIDGRRSLLQEDRRRRRGSSAAAASPPDSSGSRKLESAELRKPAASKEDHGPAESPQEDSEQQPDEEMEELSSAISALQFVPMSVRFGRGRKAGFAKQ